MIKKITKRTLIILFAFFLYMAFFKITQVNAMSVEEARKNIADLATSFYNKNSKNTLYDGDYPNDVDFAEESDLSILENDYMTNRANTYNNMRPNRWAI